MKKLSAPLFAILIMALSFAAGCTKEYSASGIKAPVEDSFNLTIQFRPMVDTLKLHLDSTYRNFWKETYSVSSFKFYVSKFDLINTDSNRTYHLNTNKYFLVDAADSTTWTVKLLAEPFTYNRISFLIGVDSARTVAGPRTGVLDSTKGMYFNRNDGYIMAKLQGKAIANGQGINYEIGGYVGDNNVLQKPILLFPFGQVLQITPAKKSVVTIDANVNAWFYNPHQVKIQLAPSCTSPGLMAKDISENYAKMFSVRNIVN